jgi:hypothetical protein
MSAAHGFACFWRGELRVDCEPDVDLLHDPATRLFDSAVSVPTARSFRVDRAHLLNCTRVVSIKRPKAVRIERDRSRWR